MLEHSTDFSTLQDVRWDLRERWARGERVLIEEYLAHHPELKSRQLIVDLIYSEFCLREDHGESPSRGEYLERFPDAAPELRLLFEVHDEMKTSLAQPLIGEVPGSIIGPYRLVARIGEGGMGVVYLAQQTGPVERRVALKVVKQGMHSPSVIARFEAERRALALMDHPNIAKIFDSGTTPSGHPYFAMELVNGVALNQFCDKLRLPLCQRLELFVSVCQAVQHAHQKAVIHRDLKPSNILVSLCDGKPLPKIIDFGVAKATGSRLTEQTTLTQPGQLVGTFAYMSPEQGDSRQTDVDTRSDIYSLGAILYELLTGTTPLPTKALKEAPFPDVLRLIREQDAPMPSERLNMIEDRSLIATNRGSEPKKLPSLLCGELDWIVMKALEKERDQRYQTANDLAKDVLRYLALEPVQAGPPTAVYRLWKFIRRNRGLVASAACFLLLCLAGVIGTAWGLIRAEHSAAEARIARANEAVQQKMARMEANRATQFAAFVERLFRSADELGLQGTGFRINQEQATDLTVAELVSRATQWVATELSEHPGTRADLLVVLGEVYRSQGKYQRAERLLNDALSSYRADPGHSDRKLAQCLNVLGCLHLDQGRFELSERLHREALARLADCSGPDDRLTLQVKIHLAWGLLGQNRYAESERLFGEVVEACKGNDKKLALEMAMGETGLVSALLLQGKSATTEQANFARVAANIPSPLVQGVLAYRNIVTDLEARRFDVAMDRAKEMLTRVKSHLGMDHPLYAKWLGIKAEVQKQKGDYLGYAISIREAIDRGRKLVPGHPKLWEPMNELAKYHHGRGDFDEARRLYQESLQIVTNCFNPEDPRFFAPAMGLHAHLGQLAYDRGDYASAAAEYSKALAVTSQRATNDREKAWHRAGLLQADGAVLMESGQLTAALNRFQEARRLRRNPDAKSFELSRSLIEITRLAGDHAAAWKEWKQLQADLKTYFRSVRRQPGEADLQAVPAFEALRDYPLAAQTMAGIVRHTRNDPTPQALELHYALYKHAGLLVQLQQVEKAVPLLSESLEGFVRAFGREHTACEDAILEMAKAYAVNGDGAKAEALAREACGLREKRLGRDHLWTANCRAELARILSRLGKCKEATKILTETLNTRSARLPLTDSTVWKNQVELVESFQAGNDHRAAAAALQKYRKRLAGMLPDGSYQVAELESLLAESLIELGDYAGAEPLLLKAYAHQRQDIPQLCDGLQATRLRLVRLYERWGKASETPKYAQR